MQVPVRLLPLLLRLHAHAERAPYFHLPGYMHRWWVLGDRSLVRNRENKEWHGRTGGPLYRWTTERFAIRAHTILRSDKDRHLHDHPCWSLSIVLDGGYWEVLEPNATALRYPQTYERVLDLLICEPRHLIEGWAAQFNVHWRGPGAVVYRSADTFHRLILPIGVHTKSLFAMGRKSNNSWGFLTSKGKVPWREYLNSPEEA